jgi:hypothetical protein
VLGLVRAEQWTALDKAARKALLKVGKKMAVSVTDESRAKVAKKLAKKYAEVRVESQARGQGLQTMLPLRAERIAAHC